MLSWISFGPMYAERRGRAQRTVRLAGLDQFPMAANSCLFALSSQKSIHEILSGTTNGVR